MRNLHQIILQEYGLEVQRLFRDWERLRLRETDYKNHRIFTLRCLHKELVPVSIKLKSILNTARAKKIDRKAEKDLIQARITSINSILNNMAKQIEECRSQLASIISTERLRECQGFVDKVGEIRFNKVKLRQIKKFQNLVNKKEGNITWSSNNNNNLPQAGNNLMANRQAGAHLPPKEGSNTPPARPLPPPMEEEGLSSPQAGLVSSSQAIAHLPSQEGSNSQAIAHLPSWEGSNSPLATALLPPSKGSSFTVAIACLPPREESNSPIAGSSSQAIAHLPPSEGSNSTPALLPSREGGSPPKQVNLTIKIGQAGKASGVLTGTGQPRLPRRTALSPEKTTPLLPLLLGPQGSSNEDPNPKWVINISNKPLTPAQRSVLAKGPNYAVTPRQPPNLEYITAIEAACTKLSQEDAEELRADINRVLRSSHPPNQI